MAELSELSEKLSAIKSQIEADLTGLTSSKGVFEYKKSVMDSKEGKIGSLMKEMGKIPKEQKAEYGKMVNELRNWATEKFDAMDAEFKAAEQKARYEAEAIDVTLPSKKLKKGYLMPATGVLPPFLMLAAVLAMAPVAGIPPKHADAMLPKP